MLLTISTTHFPATDLGYLLHKHPQKVQSFDISTGKAHVFYPEANEQKCTAALLLDIDPIKLTRRHKGSGAGFILKPYVNDRPYTASSFMSVAIAKVFSSAISGKCKDKPELVNQELPFEIHISVLPVRGGNLLLNKLFEPLGYQIEALRYPLDPCFSDWGKSIYYTVLLKHNQITLHQLLTHLYVLIPVLDNEKHYWIGQDEVEKLLKKGKSWLINHPEKEWITRRYLKRLSSLTRQALDRLSEADQTEHDKEADTETVIEKKLTLNKQRLSLVVEVLKHHNIKKILDLGCGEGKLLWLLLKEKSFEKIIGMDVSSRALMIAGERLHLQERSPKFKERIQLIQGSLLYRDQRLEGYDGAAIIEVIEHLDSPGLTIFERIVFEFIRPEIVIITTPNIEYNIKFETLTPGKFRHHDHRFEWTREEFQTWAKRIIDKYDYQVEFFAVGDEDELVGSPTQMGVFKICNHTVT